MTNNLPPAGLRAAIVLIGNRNAGKSSLINALTGQEISIVSPQKGTTTDAVGKAFELIPAGAVTLYDTAGLDDEGDLGAKRVCATEKVLSRADLVLVVIGKDGISPELEKRMYGFKTSGVPFIPVFNFADEAVENSYSKAISQLYEGIFVSAKTGEGIEALKKRIADMLQKLRNAPQLLDGLVKEGDVVVLVTPIDNAAPKGRLILPQVQVLREVLDMNAVAVVAKESELAAALERLKRRPQLVITDSQVVGKVFHQVPADVPLTTFSMLFARAKGNFMQMLDGARALLQLPAGAKILIGEGCSHHITCDDIGRVKLPNLICQTLLKDFEFVFSSGNDFPENLKQFDLVIHCGGCMLAQGEMRRRLKACQAAGVKITNYGMVISEMEGILDRTAAPLEKMEL